MSTPTGAPRAAHEDDRGLAAVRRVRSARESDSRIGLQRALAESRASDAAAGQAADRLACAPGFAGGDARDFQLHRQLVDGLAEHKRQTEEAAAAGRRVAEQARLHWLRDRTALRTADLLLERRADLRAVERNRREAGQLDDLAASGWLRRNAAAGEGS